MSENTFIESDETLEAIVKELEHLKIGATHLREVAARTDGALELSQSAVTFAQQTLTTLDTFGKQNRADMVILARRFSDEVIPLQVSTNLKIDKVNESVANRLQPGIDALQVSSHAIQSSLDGQLAPTLQELKVALPPIHILLADELLPMATRLVSDAAAIQNKLDTDMQTRLATIERVARWNRTLLWTQLAIIVLLAALCAWQSRQFLGLVF